MILSDLYVNKFLDLLRGQAIEPVAKYYVGLLDENSNELTNPSYSRVELDANLATWTSTQNTVGEISTGSSREISNTVIISWGTALETWGPITKVRFYLTDSDGTYFADHVVNENIVSGTTVEILIGDFKISS